MAAELLREGLAHLMFHKKTDDSRSSAYAELVQAEAAGRNDMKGMHSGKEPPVVRRNDASENVSKAKQFLPVLQRTGRVRAVVEHVFSGARFKLFVPRESILLTFALAGVKCSRAGRNESEAGEPFGQESLYFATSKCHQRDVEVEFESVDKTGCFLGTLWLTRTENISVSVLSEGLATVFPGSVEYSAYGNLLLAAERDAKTARRNMWRNYDAAAEREHEAQQAAAPQAFERRIEQVDIVVSAVAGNGRLYGQIMSDAVVSKYQQLFDELSVLNKLAETELPAVITGRPRVGELVLAKSSVDGHWRRARIKKHQANQKAEVLFVDDGNFEVIDTPTLRTLPASMTALPPFAVEMHLAYIKCPRAESNYGQSNVQFTKALVSNLRLVANIEHHDGSNS